MKWLAVVAAVVVFAALFVARAARAGDLPIAGHPAPDFQLPDQHGAQHALTDLSRQMAGVVFLPQG